MILGNVTFTLLSFFYMILLTLVYFLKPKIKSEETKLYSWLVIVCMAGVTISLGTYYFMVNMDKYPILNYIFSKLYLVFVLAYLFVMTFYVIYLTFSNMEKIQKNFHKYKYYTFWILSFITMVLLVFIMILDIKYEKNGNVVYSYGQSVDLMFGTTRYFALSWLVLLIAFHRHVDWKKAIPMIAYIILGSGVSIIQRNNPELLLSTALMIFVTILMYFTIENPDVKMIEQLNIAKAKAEQANSAKTDFLSNMSHEIRTPLNAIVGFSNLLLENENVPEDAKDEVKDIVMASDNLLEIVNGILDISKIEANRIEIVDGEYDTNKLLQELVALSKGRLGEKPIEFKTSFDPTIPKVLYGDVTRIKQICVNLLTNAIKYTKEGTIDFKVSSFTHNGVCRLIISVEDTGIGIKQESIGKLFNRFERMDMENNMTIEGTGLGLAITKKLIDLMHGKIIVQSVYGKGSKFTVGIDQRIVENPTINLEETETKHEIHVENKKVLVVDDNKINLKVASKLLEGYGLTVECVESGFECINKVSNGEKYDIILLDDMMPKMSGVETLHKLKDIPGYSIKTIALTANAITGMKEKYLADGFDDYLAKPINKDELNRIIDNYLNNN